ncbi:MAG TPA: thioredoxin domain-containing protein [Thermoleophilaceae bacterium]
MTDAAALAERRRRRLWLFGASALLVAILIGIGIGVSRTGGGTGTTTGPPEGVAEVQALYRGIPQRGPLLGDSGAKVTLAEFADLQCPFCGEYSREVMPEVVRRYVRPGKVRINFRGLDFIGPDSTEAMRFAAAAGMQGRLFQVVDLIYRNQGAENDGWVDDEYLGRIGRAAGLDVPKALAARSGMEPTQQIDAAKAEGERAGVEGTPTLVILRAGSAATFRKLEADEVSLGEVTKALEAALGD